jgi:DNA-binding HxlR family transcriptional regulator
MLASHTVPSRLCECNEHRKTEGFEVNVYATIKKECNIRRIFPMKTKEELPECPVAVTVSLVGSKWKLLIIRNLLVRPWRFNELQKSLEGISQKVLTESLRSMEADGIITRTVYPEVPPRVEYALSELGETLRPILTSMGEWGEAYQSKAL